MPAKPVACDKCTNSTSSKADNKQEMKCGFCKTPRHTMDVCRSFSKKSHEEKIDHLRKERLALCVFDQDTRLRAVAIELRVNFVQDNIPHAYIERNRNSRRNKTIRKEPLQRVIKNSGRQHRLTSMIVPVYVSAQHPEKEILTYALLDTMSDTSFVAESLVKQLGIKSTETKLQLTTLSNQHETRCLKISDLGVRGYSSSKRLRIGTSYTREDIPVNKDHIPTPSTAECWPHLIKI